MEQRPKLELVGSRLFTAWLAQAGASLAFTTYQAGKLFLVGLKPDGRLSIFERTFSRCMGLGTGPGGTLWMSSLYQLWRFENFLDPGATKDGHDRSTCRSAGTQPATSTSTTSTPTPTAGRCSSSPASTASRPPPSAHSFAPLWRPPFIDRLAAEDRCHLNGLAMRDGRPAFVTCDAVEEAQAGRDRREAEAG